MFKKHLKHKLLVIIYDKIVKFLMVSLIFSWLFCSNSKFIRLF